MRKWEGEGKEGRKCRKEIRVESARSCGGRVVQWLGSLIVAQGTGVRFSPRPLFHFFPFSLFPPFLLFIFSIFTLSSLPFAFTLLLPHSMTINHPPPPSPPSPSASGTRPSPLDWPSPLSLHGTALPVDHTLAHPLAPSHAVSHRLTPSHNDATLATLPAEFVRWRTSTSKSSSKSRAPRARHC